MTTKNIFITGGAGYVGAMLADSFSKRSDVSKVILLDKEPETKLTLHLPKAYKDKIIYIQDNLENNAWQEKVKVHNPDIIIHTAWQIRSIYKDKNLSYKWNIEGSQNLFDFAFEQNKGNSQSRDDKNVEKLIYFSTIASYGADHSNAIDYFFTEKDNFRKSDYHYAEEKRMVEKNLETTYNQSNKNVQVSIIRPASITGPRRKGDKLNFNLQSALSGKLKGGIYTIISMLTSVLPVTKNWLRQYIHEDDISHMVKLLAFNENTKSPCIISHKYEIFNACPPGDPVLKRDMAKVLNKKIFILNPRMIQFAFSIFWHLTHGQIPTSPGSWRGYSYPIAVDGSKISKMYNYKYIFSPLEAFTTLKGVYEK